MQHSNSSFVRNKSLQMLLHIVSVYDDVVEAVLKGARGNTSLTFTIVDCLVPKQCMNIWLFSVPDHTHGCCCGATTSQTTTGVVC